MKIVVTLMAVVLFAAPAFAEKGAADVHAGNDLYRKGKFQEAWERYKKAAEKNPAEAKIEYDLGAAAYKSKDYDAAVDHFQKSLLTDDDKLRRDVHFNLGDAFYHAGISREDKDIDQGIKRLESSLASFEKARGLDPKDRQASENYEFVKKEIERLEEKKKQQEDQKQKSEQQKKDQQKDQDQKNSDQQKDQDKQRSDEEKNQEQKDQQKSDDQKSQEQKDQDNKDQQGKDQQKKDQEGKDQQEKDGQDKKDGKDNKGDKNDKSNDVPEKQPKDQPSQSKDQGQPDDPKKDQNNGASGQMVEGQISSQKDANDMVDNFERNELPKGLLNFIRKSGEARSVDKDW